MPKSKQTTPVDDNETLLRAIYSPSFFDEDGFLSPSAFELVIQKSGDPEKGISVIRPAIAGYEKFLSRIKKKTRTEGDVFLCTVELIAKIVKGITLKSSREILIDIIPTRRNYHAEIRLYIDDKLVQAGCQEPEYLLFLRRLVDLVQDQIKRPA